MKSRLFLRKFAFLLILSFSLNAEAIVRAGNTDSTNLKPDDSISNADTAAIHLAAPLKHLAASHGSTQQIIRQYHYLQNTFPSPLVQRAMGNLQSDYQERTHQNNEDWQFFVLIFLLALLALIKYSYSKEWSEINLVLRNWFPARAIRREASAGTSLGTILFTSFALVALPFYVFALVHQSNINFNEPDWMVAVLLAAGITAVIFLRYILLELAAWLLPDGKNIRAYNLSEMQINRTWSVFLFPFIPLILFVPDPFNDYFWWVSLLVCLFFVMLRVFRGMSYGGSAANRNFFHFLLYICSLEIAPVFILIRLLEHMTSGGFNFLKLGG